MLKRAISLELKSEQSAFFFGPRKTGKSTYLKASFPNNKYYDLLKTNEYTKLLQNPHLLREELLALQELNKLVAPVIIDEIQKIPLLLDEVHWLIENSEINFILSGSSARKLYQAGVNLLGGRALGKKCYPLSYIEFINNNEKFNLLTAMQRGLVPSHYLSPDYEQLLDAYISDYLTLEIKNEGLVRNLPAFAKFLESVGFCNGELINYSNIAQDCGVSANTVKEYYQILIDTLLGYYILPLTTSNKRQTIISTPKFYFFDIGIANWLSKVNISELKGVNAGKSFEHFIFVELQTYAKYNTKFIDINYWRTKNGLEVDFIISKKREIKLAIECKISRQVKASDIKGIQIFSRDHNADKLIVVSMDSSLRLIKTTDNKDIYVYPWQEFLTDLWAGKFF